jgi:asparaginyl-tRNA synthetase
MKLTTIAQIYADHKPFLDTDIILNGRVRSVRDSKTFGFIELNDWSYLKNIQVVFENNLPNFDEICKFTTGTSMTVEGTLVASQWAKQAFEIKAKKVTLVGECPSDYPLQKKW